MSISEMAKGSLPYDYLEISLFKSRPKVRYLRSIADRILSLLEPHKSKLLYYAGSLCLINLVILSSFIHSFYFYHWPSSLIDSLSSSIQNFMWSRSICVLKEVIVAWEFCCLPKQDGGLGSTFAVLIRLCLAN